jgi:hypothetical protein
VTGPRFFATPTDLAARLAELADEEPELVIGRWKTGTGRPSVTWEGSVDEGPCVWGIDGVRRVALEPPFPRLPVRDVPPL